MNRRSLKEIYTIIKVLYLAMSKENSKLVIVSKRIKEKSIIELKNGSSIALLPEQSLKDNHLVI